MKLLKGLALLLLWWCLVLGFYMSLLLLLSYLPNGPSAHLEWGPLSIGEYHESL